MKITGKVHEICEKQEGQTTSGGFWTKQMLVITNHVGEKDVYVGINFFGESRVKMLEGLQKGQLVDVAFAPESREYMGKWYADLIGFGVKAYVPAKSVQQAVPAEQAPAEPVPADAPLPEMAKMPEEKDLDF